MKKLNEKNSVTSVELLNQINLFREQEGNRKVLRHDTLMASIKVEFETEIASGKLELSSYKNPRGRVYPCFELTVNQAKQMLFKESKFVRKAAVTYVAKLEATLKEINESSQISTGNYLEDLKQLIASQE